ncbi:MAG: tetratricopeptide repeat protein, partial [Anaerolineaceae bacterium]|nr:tetratricopeptide repeat protein [Anaerolineaceae bacterium]
MGINLLFNSDDISPELDYWFTGPRYYSPSDLVADPTIEIKDGLRLFNFKGTASKVVSVFMPNDGCLWVIDPNYALTPEKISQLTYYGEITNQDQIVDIEAQPNHLSKIIDTGPQTTWCYFFEKGDLAQSKGNYEEAVVYYEKAVANQFSPFKAVELMPFVKAYAHLGRIEEAVELTSQAFNLSADANPSICQVWHDVLSENSAILLSSVETVYNSQNCSILEP